MSLKIDFTNYLINEKRFSSHTVLAYSKDVDQFVQLLELRTNQDIIDLGYQSIRRYIVELVDSGLDNRSVNRKLSSIKTFYKFLKIQNYISENPTLKVKSLKQKKVLPEFVPESQMWDEKMFDHISDPFERAQDELILELFYQTGIRLSELINLEEKNITSTTIKVLGKRNKERIIPISAELFAKVEKYRIEKNKEGLKDPTLFITKKCKKLNSKFVYNKVNFYLGMATNLSKRSPHVLRHTFATHMLNNGASLESIKKLLGHTDLAATQVYTHNSFAQLKSIYKQAHPRGGQ